MEPQAAERGHRLTPASVLPPALRTGTGPVLVRAAVVALACVAAYHYSLATLLGDAAAQTPLAYLSLVPIVALFLIPAQLRLRPAEPDIHDRYLDYMLGLFFLALALVVELIVPARLSTFFWEWRLDLISLPLFAAGAIALVFGTRVVWSLRLPISFLLLAWPPPYQVMLGSWMTAFTNGTLTVVRALLGVVPLATPVPGGDGSQFQVAYGGGHFVVAVGSACAGANSLVAFLLAGIALLTLVRGGTLARLLWLAAGLSLIWLAGLLRILAIVGAGHALGESFALDFLHPFAGLLAISGGVAVMVLLLPAFRLQVRIPPARTQSPGQPGGRLPVRRAGVALTLVMAASVLAGLANLQLRQYQALAEDLGPSQLQPMALSRALVPGWAAVRTDDYSWARQYFGRDSSWVRYLYSWQPEESAAAAFRSTAPVTVDVISTDDLQAFSRYGFEDCFRAHDDRVLDQERVDLGAGVVGRAIAYHSPSLGRDWSAVYWEWPVRSASGERYERIVLSLAETNAGSTAPAPAIGPVRRMAIDIADLLDGLSRTGFSSKRGPTRDFLVGFAREMIQGTTRAVAADSAPRAGS